MHTHRTILRLAVLWLMLSSQVKSEEVNDEHFGFRFTVPEGFIEVSIDGGDEDLIYLFVDPESPSPRTAIQIRRMRGRIDPNQQLSADQLPPTQGMEKGIEETQWNGLTCAVTRYTVSAGDSVIVCYGIQFPLPDEAVQLQVCGPEERDAELRQVLDQSVAAFVSTRPIATDGVAARRMSAVERDSQLFSGILGLTLTILVLVFIVAAIGKLLFRPRRRPDDERMSPRASPDQEVDVVQTTCPWCDAEIRSDVDRCTECQRPV